MNKIKNRFAHSALVTEGAFLQSDQVMNWFRDRQAAHRFMIEQIPFCGLKNWGFSETTGNLEHSSGRFFSIEGIRVQTNWGLIPEWEQPIINQPEIGYLGFIVKEFNGVLHFLVQAKMEPGNINMIQLAPTLQATRSNFTRVHKGRSPRYLEYFTNRTQVRVLVDSLQSEQGARFLRKRNRNIIIEVFDTVPVHEDYCWLTLGQILQVMRLDNIINMDARTVLSCIHLDFSGHLLAHNKKSNAGLLRSFDPTSTPQCSNEEIISWFTEQKFKHDLEIDRIPLCKVRNWFKTDKEIHHESGNFFSIIACAVEADNREVQRWTQPLVKAQQEGLIAFLIKELNGVLHFLVQAKVEPGNFDVVEMAPTVQCITGSYHHLPENELPPFVSYVLNAADEQIEFNSLQSEEGGRFYREENRNLIVTTGNDFPDEIPDNYIWMTAFQLKEFIKYNNFVNVQARCLLSSLSLA